MRSTRCTKVCSATTLALMIAALAGPASAQPGINLGIVGGLSASLDAGSLVSAVPLGGLASVSSGLTADVSVSAPLSGDPVQQVINELGTMNAEGGSMPTLPGLEGLPVDTTISAAVESTVNALGASVSPSLASELSGGLSGLTQAPGEQSAPTQDTETASDDSSSAQEEEIADAQNADTQESDVTSALAMAMNAASVASLPTP